MITKILKWENLKGRNFICRIPEDICIQRNYINGLHLWICNNYRAGSSVITENGREVNLYYNERYITVIAEDHKSDYRIGFSPNLYNLTHDQSYIDNLIISVYLLDKDKRQKLSVLGDFEELLTISGLTNSIILTE